jgi:hypothetical protein
MVRMTGEKCMRQPADEVHMSWFPRSGAQYPHGMQFWKRETGTSNGWRWLAERDGDKRKGNTVRLA